MTYQELINALLKLPECYLSQTVVCNDYCREYEVIETISITHSTELNGDATMPTEGKLILQ